jgi:MFS family permease
MAAFKGLAFLRADPRLLAFGFLLSFGSSFGQTFFISLFAGDIRAAFDLSNGEFGAVYSVGTLASAAALVWTGHWIDRIDLRHWALVLITALAGACLVMGLSQNVVVLAVAVFLLRQTGQGLMTHTAMTSQARYYDRARGRAVATAGFGFPLGEALFPVVAVAIAAAVGWRQSWFLFAAIIVIAILPLSLWLLRGHGGRHQRYLAGLQMPPSATETQPVPVRHWNRREVIRDNRFYMLLPVVLAPSFIVTGIFFHQVHLAETKGWGMGVWATTYTAYAAASVLSGFAFGVVVDRVGAVRTLPWLLPPLALACLFLGLTGHILAAWGFMICGGVSAGMMATFVGAFWAEVYGTRHLGAIRALTTALMVLSTALSPVIMGVLLDGGATMEALTLASAAYCLLATGVAVIARRLYATTRETGPTGLGHGPATGDNGANTGT